MFSIAKHNFPLKLVRCPLIGWQIVCASFNINCQQNSNFKTKLLYCVYDSLVYLLTCYLHNDLHKRLVSCSVQCEWRGDGYRVARHGYSVSRRAEQRARERKRTRWKTENWFRLIKACNLITWFFELGDLIVVCRIQLK